MTAPHGASPSSLTRRAVRGVAWTLPTSLGSRIVGLIGTILLARYLAPAEYGEVSAAAIVATTATSVSTFGIGTYLVSNRDVSRAEAFHATCWFLTTGAIVVALVAALSGPLGAWVEAPNLGRYMPVFVVGALLDRVFFLPERMLVRKLRFGRLSLARAAGELTYTGVSLGLAALGGGAMAIAWGSLARSALRFVLIVPAVDRREWLEFHRLRLAPLLKILGYGMSVSVASIASFGMRRWDNLLVSRYFGPGVMGVYNYAYNLADTPAVAVGEQMSDVVSASFPHAERSKRASALVRACTMTSLIMFPLAFGLGAVAPTVAQAFFDQKWRNIGMMLGLLSVLSATRPMAHILFSYFNATERPRVVAGLEWLSLAAIVLAIATVGRAGIGWTCGAVGTVFVLRTLAGMWAVHRLDGVPVSTFLLPLTRPLFACFVMVAAILGVRPLLLELPPGIQLLIEVTLGALVYLAGALLVFRSASREFLELVRLALTRRSASPPPHATAADRGPVPETESRQRRGTVHSISVVIPYYNGSRFIAEALASVRAQTLAPLEIIVVDDGSRPEEARALDAEARDCLVIHLPRNRGVSVARNVGIARARGEWIAFLDCDDLWEPRKLELQAVVAEAHADCRAVHCGLKGLTLDGKEEVFPKGEIVFDDFLVFPCPIFPSATMMQRQALLECGLFDPTLRCCQDLELFMRFCSDGGKFHSVPEPLTIRRIQSEGLSRNVAVFWSEAARTYRYFLPMFEDQRRGRAALREVHVDMALRTIYARDFRLLQRMLRRAMLPDVPISSLAVLVVWRVVRNRLQRIFSGKY